MPLEAAEKANTTKFCTRRILKNSWAKTKKSSEPQKIKVPFPNRFFAKILAFLGLTCGYFGQMFKQKVVFFCLEKLTFLGFMALCGCVLNQFRGIICKKFRRTSRFCLLWVTVFGESQFFENTTRTKFWREKKSKNVDFEGVFSPILDLSARTSQFEHRRLPARRKQVK